MESLKNKNEIEQMGFHRNLINYHWSTKLCNVLRGTFLAHPSQDITGSGKTLAYLLLIFSVINTQRLAVQALIVVPTRELGMQVANVARMLAVKSDEPVPEDSGAYYDSSGWRNFKKTEKLVKVRDFSHWICEYAIPRLDVAILPHLHTKRWLKAEPPTIMVATLGSLCQMIESQMIKLESMCVLVIDEVDFMFNSSREVSYLRKILISYSSIHNRQTVFVSASIPQHRRFLHDCIQQKWTKVY